MSNDASDPYDFREQLNFGKKWERRVRPHLERYLTALTMKNVSFDEDPETQLAGIDLLSDVTEPDVDVKTYSHKYITEPNLFIETLSVMKEEKPGWFYTSESDLMVVIGPNKPGTRVYKRGWIVPLNTGIREWFDEALETHDWDHACVPNGDYRTFGWWVPADDIPDEFIFEFDPRPPNANSANPSQKELKEWGGVDE